jgi:hypothetical protein
MELLFDVSQLHQVKVHDMDWGSLEGVISGEGHIMNIQPRWENCGELGETLTCSCGFRSEEYAGGGCHFHQGSKDHDLDEQHRIMYTAAQVWHRAQPRLA